jgi:hypothetical protein
MPSSSRVRAAVRAAVQGNAEPTDDFIAGPAPDGYVEPASLLQEADEFFAETRVTERSRYRQARRRIAEMRSVNLQGGDSQGFKYVIPKSVKAMAAQLNPAASMDGSQLRNGFADQAAAELPADSHDDRPQHRKKRRGHYHDNFYQAQVWKKWTENAERFLSRGRASEKLFAAKGLPGKKRKQPQRSTRKL